MKALPKLKNMYLISALATIGGLLQGFDVAAMSAIIGTHQYKTYFRSPGSVLQGGITASMAGGSFCGALASNLTAERFGRRDSMAYACVIYIAGCAIMCSVQNIAQLIVSRIVNGFAVGILSSQAPVYIAEISTPKRRGRLISFQNWMITWGSLIFYFLSYGTSFLQSTASFRLPWGLQMLPAWILLVAVPSMPRSPRWLASKDRGDEALRVLADLHAKGNTMDPLVHCELQSIREKIHQERSFSSSSWLELVRKHNIVRVHCAMFVHIWSQFSGFNVLSYYIVYVFSMAGIQGNQALLSASLLFIISSASCFLAVLFLDRWRRRWTLMTGSTFSMIFLFTVAGLMAAHGHAVPGGLNGVPAVTWVMNQPAASKAVIACSYLFVVAYAPTWGPIAWLYPPEIIPLYIRTKTVSVATSLNWACNFALTFLTPSAFEHIQWRTFVIFGVFNLTSLIHAFCFFQETKGKTLEEMDEVFSQGLWAFKVEYQESRLMSDVEMAKQDIKARTETAVKPDPVHMEVQQ